MARQFLGSRMRASGWERAGTCTQLPAAASYFLPIYTLEFRICQIFTQKFTERAAGTLLNATGTAHTFGGGISPAAQLCSHGFSLQPVIHSIHKPSIKY